MNRLDNDLPEIVSIAPCTGWVARYSGDGAGEPIQEPIAAWGVMVETIGGERTRFAVALVPEGGELVPARDAQNFEDVIYSGGPVAGHHITPAQLDKAGRLIGTVQLWLDRVAMGPNTYVSEADVEAHRENLRQLAVLWTGLQDAGATT